MKEEAPLGIPFIGEPRGGRPAKDSWWGVNLCGQSPSILSQICGGWAKEGDSGGERREKVVGWPPIFGRLAMLDLHTIPTFILHFMLLLSCSLHWPKASKAKPIPFIFFQSSFHLFILKFSYFILCNDEINMLWKRKKQKMLDKRGIDKNQVCKWWKKGEKWNMR
jgi:hypothetical protein